MNKVVDDVSSILGAVEDGVTLLVGGFGVCGVPETAIEAVGRSGARRLRVVSNNCGLDGYGLGTLLRARQIDRMLASYVGENEEFARQLLAGEIDVELVPQGTLAERLRAGGAGVPAFYTRTGVGTDVAQGKEVRAFDGVDHLLERAITGDYALVRAWKADTFGNLVYRRTARNFNPLVAMAGRVTIAEVDEIVEAGELDGDHIHTPGLFVQHVLSTRQVHKPIERRVVAAARADA